MDQFKVIRLVVLVVAVAGTASLSGCVSSSKYRALEASLSSERADLQGQIAALHTQKKALEEQKAALDRDLGALNERLTQLEQQTAEVSAQKDEEMRRLKGTYDDLVKDLQSEIKQGQIKVTQIRDKLSVNLVEKVLFDSGHAEVKSQGQAVLKKVGNILSDVKGKEIRIEGYTDDVPIGESLRKKFPSNWELSTQRATNVLRFLQDEAGVDGAHLSAVGYGPFRSVADNKTPEGRAENRRIEIVLVPQDVKEVLKELR
jgi:chemotaxis protein MotB